MLRVFFGVLGIVVITDSFHRKSSQTKVREIVLIALNPVTPFSVTSDLCQ